MEVRLIREAGVELHPVEALPGLLVGDGIVWVDVPRCDEPAVRLLTQVFGCHPLAVHDCVERNPVPKLQVYADQVLVVLHSPERGEAGHVHYVELDQLVGANYLVTVHGPLNAAVDPDVALIETASVARKLDACEQRDGPGPAGRPRRRDGGDVDDAARLVQAQGLVVAARVRRRTRAATPTWTALPRRRPGLLARGRQRGRGSAPAPSCGLHGEPQALHVRVTARVGRWRSDGTG